MYGSAGLVLMEDDDYRWTPLVEPFIPTVDEPCEPQEIGRLYAPDGSLLLLLIERRLFGFAPT